MRVILKQLVMLIILFFITCSFSKMSFGNTCFVFLVPWIIFCFFYNKWYGYIVMAYALFFLQVQHSKLGFVVLLLFGGVHFLKYLLKLNRGKLETVLSFGAFFLTMLSAFLENFLIFRDFDYLQIFLISVLSYWIMRYSCKLFFPIEEVIDSRVGTFALKMIGIIFLKINWSFNYIDISLIVVLFLIFIGVRANFETGAVYCFLISGYLLLDRGRDVGALFFILTFLIAYFLDKTTKLTLIGTYIGSVAYFIYYFDINYLYIVNYILVSIIMLFIPKSILNEISGCFCGSKGYVDKIVSGNKKKYHEISDKIMKFQEVFSLVCGKLEIKERIKKNEKKLLIEEINIFNHLLENFASEIRNCLKMDDISKIENVAYQYGVDLLKVNVKENFFKEKEVMLSLRCEKKEIKNFVLPLVNKTLKQNFSITSVIKNETMETYNIILKTKKTFTFKYGVSQKSIDGELCGDSYLVYENIDKYIFAISDGMGSGKKAKTASNMALNMFKKFMDIGFELEQALTSLNSVLKIKYNKDYYSTLDLFVYDKINEEFYFYKNGASDAYVVGKENIKIKGSQLPLGIIDNITFKSEKINTSKGDCIVMVSDGVGELSFDDIEKIKGKECQKISEIILKQEKKIIDDRTVFVIKVC